MLLDTPTPPATLPRRRALDNPRILTLAVVLLIGVLVAATWLPSVVGLESLVSEVVLYALAALDLALLAALVFVLARNIIKLWVERRQGAPFARFRAKLVAALLAMTILPATLVSVIGSQYLRSAVNRWFSTPVNDTLSAAQSIAVQYYSERQQSVSLRAALLASILPAVEIESSNVTGLHALARGELATMRDGLIELYQTVPTAAGDRDAVFLLALEAGSPPRDVVRASADRLASRAAASGHEELAEDDVRSGGVLVRAAAPVRNGAGIVAGVVVVSLFVPEELRRQLRLATDRYAEYKRLEVLQAPLQTLFVGIFVTVTLLILVSATWMGLYVAKRITRPVQMLAEGARAIGAGHLDLRLEPQTSDELGALVEAFNTMAAELGSSQERLQHSRVALEQKNVEVDERRRYIETILERVATGVISLDAEGRISTVNGAAQRLLGLGSDVIGQQAFTVFSREDLRVLLPLVEATARVRSSRSNAPGGFLAGTIEEVTLARDDREIHLAAAATVLSGAAGDAEGAVLVLDDVTPLIRAQRVAAWRDVARRLAHEIKNPLTPIQLSAERLRRNLSTAAPDAKALVDECTGAIIAEVDALKSLVDEFAQFARLRGPKMAPADLNAIIADVVRLYAGVLHSSRVVLEQRLATDAPLVRVDVEQIRQVIINLVDNALEALGGPGASPRPDGSVPLIALFTERDEAQEVLRFTVVDNGPGVPAADRDKLFMPYYSTKGRGSGLGLAIVQRIISEHGGKITVNDATPTGTVFTIELPLD
ncbi:MAG TPA: ATP-binding protein [Vicinamibacterales bacterium]|nr:ATP-binding protein [Vicinamibacterales bacterium]